MKKHLRYLGIIHNISLLPKKTQLPPINLQVDVSTYCNLRCKECKRENLLPEKEINKNLSLENFKVIFDKIKPVSVNLAASGEPLMNPEIFEIIKYAKQNGAITIISSNQTIVKPELNKKIVLSGLDILKASIDGANKETYEKIRGPYFDNVIKNLAEVTELKKELKSSSPSLRIDFVVFHLNYKEMVDILYFAKKFNINCVYYRAVDKRGWSREEIEEFYKNLDFDELKNLIKKTESEAKKLNIKTNLDLWLNNFSEVEFIYTGRTSKSVRRKICILPWFQLFVSISGETSCCCSIPPFRNVSYGNILSEDFDKVWNGEKIIKTRELFKQKRNYSCYEGCVNCIPMSFKNILIAADKFPRYYEKFFK
jgi:MoaA/NifB/PqqE/SkfB family radical SAM enzyme